MRVRAALGAHPPGTLPALTAVPSAVVTTLHVSSPDPPALHHGSLGPLVKGFLLGVRLADVPCRNTGTPELPPLWTLK